MAEAEVTTPTEEQLEHRRLWVEALRSGEFIQGKTYLKYEDGQTYHCCLGVACEVANRNGVPLRMEFDPNRKYYSFDDSHSILPVKVMEWLGVSMGEVYPLPRYTAPNNNPLTIINDAGGSFEDIAKIIESGIT